MNVAPLGFFDSGIGGTSVWKEVVQLLPHENTIYLADSANAPYGIRPKGEIINLSIKNTEFLLSQGCKLIAVPCNTATTNAIQHLRDTYEVPFIGIEPAIKPAALKSNTGNVGILATKGTLSSALFKSSQERIEQDINFIEVVGTGIVELIEAGKQDSEEMHQLLLELVKPFLRAPIDYLVLGCSHYPYIKHLLQQLLPVEVQIIDSGIAVARQTKAVLEQYDMLNPTKTHGSHKLFSNANPGVLKSIVAPVNNTVVNHLDF